MGIPISDPRAVDITQTQLLWMFHAIMMEERRQEKRTAALMKAGSKQLVEILVATLGLRFRGEVTDIDKLKVAEGDEKNAENAENAEPDPDPIAPFVPFSLLVARGERIEAAQEQASKATKVEEAVSDDSAFEKMSAAIADGDLDGDLEPFLQQLEGSGKKKQHSANDEDGTGHDDIKEMLKSLGIEERPTDAPEAPHIGAKPKPAISLRPLFPENL